MSIRMNKFGRGAVLASLTGGLLIAGLARGQSAAPSPPAPETTTSYTLSVNDNGRKITLEMKNGVVTRAEVNGERVPDDRIENDGDVVRIKDDKGEVIYEHELPGDLSGGGQGIAAIADPDMMVWRSFGQPGVPGSISIGGLSPLGLFEPEVSAVGPEAFEPPPVMLGVQMGVPDSTLCGHLGIEREKTTLVTAVHEGLPAANAGLEPYDLIVSIDGKDVADPHAIRAALKDRKAGESLKLGVIHRGARKEVTLTLEAYDRQKLSQAKANRIAASDDDVFAVAMAPQPPIPPLPASIPDEYRKQIEEYFKEHGTPRAWTINRYDFSRAPRAQTQQRLLADIERRQAEAARRADQTAQQAQELARRAAEMHGGGADDMQRRMERMEKMLRELMEQQLQQPKPQEPGNEDAGSRS